MADKKSEEAKKVVSEFDKLKKSIIAKNPHVIGGKDYGKIVWCPIPSPSMTAMLGKGIPVGRMIRFRGQPSAGKSVICDYLAGCLQKECPKLFDNPLKTKILYIDFERTFEEKFATGVGVDMDNFVPITPNDIEEACDTVCDLIKTGEVAAIVFDSDGQCPSRTAMTDESGKANFGANAKAISQDRKSTRLNSGHQIISYAVFCLKKKKKTKERRTKKRMCWWLGGAEETVMSA